ncbi:MAG: PIN domain-containing protein [Candidatus Hydrogenedentota bacterium]
MKVLLDTNVLMDVLEQRDEHYEASAEVLSLGVEKRIEAIVPGHALTTVYYLVARNLGRQRADEAVDWLLASFRIVSATHACFERARGLGFADFEDAVVAAIAESERCDFIATRNTSDFKAFPVPAVAPSRLLGQITTSR